MLLLTAIHTLHDLGVHGVGLLPTQGGIPNPPPKAPPGAAGKVNDLLGFVKWGALVAIVAGFFAGIYQVTVGRWADHHGSARKGVMWLAGSFLAAVLWAIGPAVLGGLAGV